MSDDSTMSLNEATRMVYDSGLNTMVKLAEERNLHEEGCINGHLIDCAMLRIMYQQAKDDNHFLKAELAIQLGRAWTAVVGAPAEDCLCRAQCCRHRSR